MILCPPYRIDGKSLKTVDGLCRHLMKKHGCTEVSAIHDRTLKVYAADRRTVLATYRATYKPDAIVLEAA